MWGIFETVGACLNTPLKRDIAHRGLNIVLAFAAYNNFHNSEQLSEEFFIGAVSLYTFAFEALIPHSYNGSFGLLHGAAASLNFFYNPLTSLGHGYNALHRGINKMDEVGEEYRREAMITN